MLKNQAVFVFDPQARQLVIVDFVPAVEEIVRKMIDEFAKQGILTWSNGIDSGLRITLNTTVSYNWQASIETCFYLAHTINQAIAEVEALPPDKRYGLVSLMNADADYNRIEIKDALLKSGEYPSIKNEHVILS